MIDTVPPETTDDHLTASLLAPATITLSPSDALSGMSGGDAKTEYRVDAGEWMTGTSVTLSAGPQTVHYRSTDNAGNVETPEKSFTVMVMAPLAVTSSCSYGFAADAGSGWHNSDQAVTIVASGGSGPPGSSTGARTAEPPGRRRSPIA